MRGLMTSTTMATAGHVGDGRPDPGDATLADERITVLRSVERRAL
jgi:hypothetical protein